MALPLSMGSRRWRYLWLAFGWGCVGAVVWLSLTSRPPAIPVDIPWGDKLAHFCAYALLMGWFVPLYGRRGVMLHALLFTAMGCLLEVLQGMGHRTFEYADMVANAAGVGAGALLLATPLGSLWRRLEARGGGQRGLAG